jgi:hypothetical protein
MGAIWQHILENFLLILQFPQKIIGKIPILELIIKISTFLLILRDFHNFSMLAKKSKVKLQKKNVSRIRKKTFYLQLTPEGHQKSIFNTPKVKKN